MADTANPTPAVTETEDQDVSTESGDQGAAAASGSQVVRKKKKKRRRLSLDIEEVDASEVLERKISS